MLGLCVRNTAVSIQIPLFSVDEQTFISNSLHVDCSPETMNSHINNLIVEYLEYNNLFATATQFRAEALAQLNVRVASTSADVSKQGVLVRLSCLFAWASLIALDHLYCRLKMYSLATTLAKQRV